MRIALSINSGSPSRNVARAATPALLTSSLICRVPRDERRRLARRLPVGDVADSYSPPIDSASGRRRSSRRASRTQCQPRGEEPRERLTDPRRRPGDDCYPRHARTLRGADARLPFAVYRGRDERVHAVFQRRIAGGPDALIAAAVDGELPSVERKAHRRDPSGALAARSRGARSHAVPGPATSQSTATPRTTCISDDRGPRVRHDRRPDRVDVLRLLEVRRDHLRAHRRPGRERGNARAAAGRPASPVCQSYEPTAMRTPL